MLMSTFSAFQAYILLISLFAYRRISSREDLGKEILSKRAKREEIREEINKDMNKESRRTWFLVPMLYMSVQLIGNACLTRAIVFNLKWIWLLLGINILLFIVGLLWFHWISVLVVIRIAQRSLTFTEINIFFVFMLGAVGVTICTILDLAQSLYLMGLLDSAQPLKLLTCFFWGFGVWIVGFTFIRWCYQNQKKMPIGAEWGIYIFSFQVYTIACHKMAAEFFSPLMSGVSSLMTILLIVLWCCFLGEIGQRYFLHKLFCDKTKEK